MTNGPGSELEGTMMSGAKRIGFYDIVHGGIFDSLLHPFGDNKLTPDGVTNKQTTQESFLLAQNHYRELSNGRRP